MFTHPARQDCANRRLSNMRQHKRFHRRVRELGYKVHCPSGGDPPCQDHSHDQNPAASPSNSTHGWPASISSRPSHVRCITVSKPGSSGCRNSTSSLPSLAATSSTQRPCNRWPGGNSRRNSASRDSPPVRIRVDPTRWQKGRAANGSHPSALLPPKQSFCRLSAAYVVQIVTTASNIANHFEDYFYHSSTHRFTPLGCCVRSPRKESALRGV